MVRDLNAESFIWSIIEINTGLICACVPVLKPFFREIVLKAVMVRSWAFGKRKSKWFGYMLRDEGAHTHRSYVELEHGKEVRSEDSWTGSLTDSSAPESTSNGTGALWGEKWYHPLPHYLGNDQKYFHWIQLGSRRRFMCISLHCMQGETAYRNYSMNLLHNRHSKRLPTEEFYYGSLFQKALSYYLTYHPLSFLS